MRFADYTILPNGEKHSKRKHYSEMLVRSAVDVFAQAMLPSPCDFRAPIPVREFAHIQLQFTSTDPASALATFWAPERGQTEMVPLTTSVLLRGTDRHAEKQAQIAAQGLIVKLLRDAGAIDAGMEPAYDLIGLPERPMIASIVIYPGRHPDMQVIADMETCLAAAWFEIQQ